jgi:DNA-binding NtrC family response regulator
VAETPAGGRKDRILVVDDDEFVCNSLKWLLLDEGYDVAVAPDGKAALEVLSRERFDLILTDLMMPEVDGLAVLQEVKRTTPHTAVIILTGYGTLEAAMAALKDGAYDFLTKPCDDGEMKYKIKGALEQKALKQRLAELEDSAGRLAAAGEMVRRFAQDFDRELERISGSSAEELKMGLAGIKRRFEELRHALGDLGEQEEDDDV